MSNSPIVSHTNISPHRTSPRNHKIDTVTIHCAVGQCTVESLGAHFAAPERKASANYGIGYDGRVGMYCEESDRSWCSSSGSNDNRAVTIEVASDTFYPYAVTEEAYESLIELLVDICKRNEIDQLRWLADPTLVGQTDLQNMTAHRWFAPTECPGDYLFERFGDIAGRVNERLSDNTDSSDQSEEESDDYVDFDNIPDDWATDAVCWAADEEILYGDENGDYHLHKTCTRQEMIVFLHRVYNKIKDIR